jgi:hypothetical protein
LVGGKEGAQKKKKNQKETKRLEKEYVVVT